MLDGSPLPEGDRPSGRASSTGPLKEILKRVRSRGAITFAEFMGLALYMDGEGYYTGKRERWGEAGDYVTNLDISPVFSKLVAKEINEMWASLGSPGRFTLVEAGAGRGLLSIGIRKTVDELYPGLGRALDIKLIELNPDDSALLPPSVSWHRSLDEIASPVSGCILTNELIDAFPVHRVIGTGDGGFAELYVALVDDRFVEVPGEPSTERLAKYMERFGIRLDEGQKAEVNLAAVDWIRKAARLLDKGFVFTIDYGLPGRELYSQGRSGSLICHYRHTVNDNPFVNIGSQDITTHADFTALKAVGEEEGLKLTGFTTQKNFLLGLGIAEELKETSGEGPEGIEAVTRNRSIGLLINPGGAGETFKVLIQHKGIDRPALSGFSFRDLGRYLS
ncbi:MAG: SAM-dependent methyltransferase [Deltaproteobacteria bacterium]|nr:SAM-dependent methyltransferase [Deltaproteobacteria bacterium]